MILVAGESLIDLLPRELAGQRVFLPVPGGSPFNVALAVGRLGIPVRFLGGRSTDALGEQLTRALTESHVDLSLCPVTSALATLGFVTLDDTTKAARYAFYTEGTSGCGLTLSDVPTHLPDDVKCLHIGSFSLGVEPIASAVECLVERHGTGRLVSLDPNLRPPLIRDEPAYRSRLNRLLRRADLVKASIEDLGWLRPGVAPCEFAQELLRDRVSLVVVTQGSEGATAYTREVSVTVPAAPTQLVDTVGAGDTFQAALLAWLARQNRLHPTGLATLREDDLQACLTTAARAAAINCARAGCNPPWATELDFD